MRRLTIIVASMLAVLVTGVLVVFGQDTERSQLIQYVEEKISSPSYQIRLNGLEGTLSSEVSLASITIADEDGIWLSIEKPNLVWTRSALLSGRLVVDSLNAEKINFVRKPKEDTSLPAPESSGLAIPELPVAIVLKELDLPLVELGPDIIDLASKVSVAGGLIIDDGSMDVNLEINRLDGEGGKLAVLSKFEKSDKTLDLDIQLSEPRNGIVASTMGLEGRPPVNLSIKGKAPLSELKVELAFDVDQNRILDGTLLFGENESGVIAKLDMDGPISEVLPARTRAFFGSQSVLAASMEFPNSGGIIVEQSSLKSGAINLNANGTTTQDGFLSALNLEMSLSSNDNEQISLPAGKNDAIISSARLILDYNANISRNWNGTLHIKEFRNDVLSLGTIALNANGTVDDALDAGNRSVVFSSDGEIYDITANDPSIADALGSSIKLAANGDWQTGNPINVDSFKVIGDTLRLAAQGVVEDFAFDGLIEAQAENLGAFAAVADNKISGSLQLAADGKILPLTGGFDIDIDGTARSFGVGSNQIDPLFGGQTKLSGAIARTTAGLGFDRFKLSNSQMEANLEGTLSSTFADISAEAFIGDIKIFDRNSYGKLEISLDLNGDNAPFDLTTQVGIKNGRLAGERVEDVALQFAGVSDGASVKGVLSSEGLLSGHSFDIAGDIGASDKLLDITGLSASIGLTKIEGNLQRQSNGLIEANLDINSSDISSLAALLFKRASGKVAGKIELRPEVDRTQTADFDLTVNQITYETLTIGNAKLAGRGNDILVRPKINADITATNINVSGTQINNLDGRIQTNGSKSNFDLDASLAQNQSRLTSVGEVIQTEIETTIILQKLLLNSSLTDARLLSPSSIVVRDQIVRFTGAELAIGGGKVDFSGTAGEQLDIAATISNVPLTILNSIDPGLDASGTLNGSLAASGRTDNPNVVFNLKGDGVSVKQISDTGIKAIRVSANGTFRNNAVRLDQLSLQNSQALNLRGSGNVPLKGAGLELGLRGGVPLSTLEQFTVERGTSIQGSADIAVNLTGSLEQPQTSGNIRVSNGTVIDPLSNVRLNNIQLNVELAGSQNATVRMQGHLASEGSVSASGAIKLSDGLPANIDILLNSASYGDGETFSTTANGKLVLNGRLVDSPLLSGDLNLLKTEISVPESFASDASLLEVEHIAPSAKTSETLARIRWATPKASAGGSSGPLRVDVNINAPNQIFVRGRGLDAELGGSIRVVGPISNVSPQGGFSLRRGRLSILGQRLDLQEGTISLAGDLDPVLDFLATTTSGDVQAFIRLQGRASDLQVSFSSNPELPEDEVLARIIFGRSVTDLSPVQIARLASVASELTGGSSPSLVNSLRESTGLDDIDVVQDEDGNAAVKAGSYVSDNVYLGVQAGRETEATINLDITDELKARGAVNSRGESTLGIFFEKDY